MIHRESLRRVPRPHPCERGYVSRDKSIEMKRRRPVCQPIRRQEPLNTSANLRSNTLSVPAQASGSHPTHGHLSEGVTHPVENRDLPRLLAAAAVNPAVSDRAMRVYTVAVVLGDRETDAPTIAAALPLLTEAQAARLLGDLVTAGLLRKRLRVVGYKDGRRVRRGAYSLLGGAL